MKNSKIEKLFMEYKKELGETPGGYISLFDPKMLEKGDPKKIGKEIQIGADVLENEINMMDFQPWEYNKGKTAARLMAAIKIYREMGIEIEEISEKQPKDYHIYIIVMLNDIISSLINHINIHLLEKHG